MPISDCPYIGLRPYTEKDHSYFFGRDGDREIVAANLKASRLTVLYGASGAGKSSLLRAAVVHDINEAARAQVQRGRQPDFVAAYCQDWRDNPSGNIAVALRSAWAHIGLTWQETPGSDLSATLQSQCAAVKGAILLVLDQFEEFLYYHDAERSAGSDLIEVLSNRGLRTNVLISLREDAVTRLDQFKDRVSALFDNYLRLDHLDLDSAREAIVRPLEIFNQLPSVSPIQIEPELVDAVLDQVRTGKLSFRDREKVGAASLHGGRERIETTYLQLVLTRVWEAEMAADSTVLRRQTLTSLGESHAIVRNHLDSLMATLSEEERQVAGRIFFYLVTPSRTKVAHTAEDLAAFANVSRHSVDAVTAKLASSQHRILRTVAPLNPDAESTRFEIYHDALADAILDWQQRFRVQEKEEALRIERARLAREEEARREELAEGERRVRQRRLMFASLAVGAVCLALAGVALYSANRARREAAIAKEQTALAVDQSRKAQQASDIAEQRLSGIRTSLLIREAALSGDTDKLDFAIKNSNRNPAIRFQTTARSLGYQDGRGQDIYRFRLAPDPATLPGGLKAVAFVTYLADHPTFKNTLMTAGSKREFAVQYDGWGCLPIVALIEYSDPARPPTVSEFDMCSQLGWR